MNGRSFTLGLGTGIIFVTVIFYFVYSFGYQQVSADAALPMTDAEVIDRATKLGMIFFTELPDNNPSVSEQETIERALRLGMIFQPTEEGIENETGSRQEETSKEMSGETSGETQTANYIEIFIPQGTGATAVAQLLEQKGVIEDHQEFLAFLLQKEETTKLHFGYFSLPEKGDYDDLLRILKRA